MCDNCVKSGKMTQEESDEQREMFAELLNIAPDAVAEMAIEGIATEFTALIQRFGYEISIGVLENGNVAVGLNRGSDGPGSGPGYVLAEFQGSEVRDMLR